MTHKKHLKWLVVLTSVVLFFGLFNASAKTLEADSSALEGVALNDPTHIYQSTSRDSKTLKTYDKGSILLYFTHTSNWYKAIVFVDGDRHTGYIHSSDVDTATDNPKNLKGLALKDNTHMYREASRNLGTVKSYPQGHLLYYETYTSDWYKAFVYNNGKRQYVYINKNDVENIVKNQEQLKGVAYKEPTKIYSLASKDSKVLKSYDSGNILYYKTLSSNWYEALVYINGKATTGYIFHGDVDNLVNNQTLVRGIAKDRTPIYADPSTHSNVLKSYGTGSTLLYKTFSGHWYEAIVYVNGQRRTGYIHKSDVETKLNEQTTLRGIGTKDRTKVYSRLSRDGNVLKSYAEGSVLWYTTLTDNWHEAIVYVNGKRRTGYIHVNDVENAFKKQESLQGVGIKSPTKIYSRASRSSNVLKSYSKNTHLLFKTFSDSWYEALVYVNGKRKNGYIHVNDVSTEKVQEEETEYDAAFEDLVDVWMSKSPQIWDDGGFRNATRDEVEYYADPENFQDRNADNFFQYLVLSQPAGLNAKEVNNKILYDKGILRGTGASFIQAGETHSMNEVYLLAHALHETGNGTAKLSTGVGIDTDTKNPTVIKDTGDPKVDHVVYNMYGIGANDNCALECGALYAYEQGWFTPEEAIVGGGKFISVNYIQAGQDTLYKMRWNPDSPGDHQYATDVNWALAQTYRIADLYSLINNYVLFFDVPKYTGTPEGDSGNSLVAYPEGVEGTTSSGGDNLNLRSKPSTSSSVIDSIPDGSKVQVLGYATGDTVNGNNTWYKVIFDGNQGWAHSDFVELDNLLQVKEVDPHLNIRKSPDTNSDDIGSLESSQFVAGVLNKGNLVTDNGWYKVYIPGTSDTGWVHGDFINERK